MAIENMTLLAMENVTLFGMPHGGSGATGAGPVGGTQPGLKGSRAFKGQQGPKGLKGQQEHSSTGQMSSKN